VRIDPGGSAALLVIMSTFKLGIVFSKTNYSLILMMPVPVTAIKSNSSMIAKALLHK
jgi:hypothetical protein